MQNYTIDTKENRDLISKKNSKTLPEISGGGVGGSGEGDIHWLGGWQCSGEEAMDCRGKKRSPKLSPPVSREPKFEGTGDKSWAVTSDVGFDLGKAAEFRRSSEREIGRGTTVRWKERDPGARYREDKEGRSVGIGLSEQRGEDECES